MIRTVISETFLEPHCILSESPVYDCRNGRLYWVDIEGQKVHWVQYSGNSHDDWKTHKVVSVKDPIGVLTLTETVDRLTVAAKYGYAIVDLRSCKNENELVKLEYLVDMTSEEDEKLRFNDGAVDANGRFFAGTMVQWVLTSQSETKDPIGKLYRYDPDGSIHIVAEGIKIPNGTGWSPDYKIMYFTDSLTHTIFQYDYDLQAGQINNKRVFVDLKERLKEFPSPEPDGLCVTEDGSIWTAIWGTGLVQRYSPQAELLAEYKFPAARTSCPAFAGQDLDELIVTSGYIGPAAGTEGDKGGELFRVKIPGVKGIKTNIFNTTGIRK